MSIFKKSNERKKNNSKFIGAFVPDEIYMYLNSCSIALGISKSILINDTILPALKQKYPEQKIFDLFVSRCKQEWEIEKKSNSNADIDKFKKQVKEELQMKNVELLTINKIIAEL